MNVFIKASLFVGALAFPALRLGMFGVQTIKLSRDEEITYEKVSRKNWLLLDIYSYVIVDHSRAVADCTPQFTRRLKWGISFLPVKIEIE
jgi:hypothetical protein